MLISRTKILSLNSELNEKLKCRVKRKRKCLKIILINSSEIETFLQNYESHLRNSKYGLAVPYLLQFTTITRYLLYHMKKSRNGQIRSAHIPIYGTVYTWKLHNMKDLISDFYANHCDNYNMSDFEFGFKFGFDVILIL